MKIPSKFLSIGLSVYAGMVYIACFSVPEEFNPSLKFLQDKLGISKNTVVKALKELENCNMINKIETGSIKRVSKYEFTNPKDWKRHEDKTTKTKTKKTKSHQTESSHEGQKQIH